MGRQINKNSSGDENYTPPEVYNIILDRMLEIWPEYKNKVIRPFWPGANYKQYNYKEGYCVIDNPPFSINKEIAQYYDKHNINYILFVQELTGVKDYMPGVIIFNGCIKYSKQEVKTMLYTNLFKGIVLDGILMQRIYNYYNIKCFYRHYNKYELYNAARLEGLVIPGVCTKLDILEVDQKFLGRLFKVLNCDELYAVADNYNRESFKHDPRRYKQFISIR